MVLYGVWKKFGRLVYFLVGLSVDFHSKYALAEAHIGSRESPKTQMMLLPDLINCPDA